MISITDKTHKPSMEEIAEYIGNPLFEDMRGHMAEEYKALIDIAFSGEAAFLGWNIRFHKAGRTLCRLYPHKGSFGVLVVVGQREKERAETLLPGFSAEMQAIYERTQEGMGQRWLMYELTAKDALYADTLALIRIRRY